MTTTRRNHPRWVLSDIEGTTTPISFVKDVLFPFAREGMEDFLRTYQNDPEVDAAIQSIARESATSTKDLMGLTRVLRQWIDEDRKTTALKTIQGLMWDEGYRKGQLKSIIYPDAAARLRRWHAAGVQLAIYSSGSVHAQKLLFEHSDQGSFAAIISAWFDTTVGNKREVSSYQRIVQSLGATASEVLFLSDVPAELDAAATAALQTCWIVRANDIQPTHEELNASRHPIARSFGEVDLIV